MRGFRCSTVSVGVHTGAIDRRTALAATVCGLSLGLQGASAPSQTQQTPTGASEAAGGQVSSDRVPFILALNTGSIMGYKLDVPAQVDLAAEAGYGGIEFWLRDIERFVQSGGRLEDVRKRLEDANLVVVGGINFNAWAAEDDKQRQSALETFRRDMEWIAALGGKAIAAAPAGIFQPPPVDLGRVAERYRVLLELGRQFGVVPQLEIWGASANLRRVSEALFVAAEAGHPDAQILLDVFHMYKGGSSPEALRLIHGPCMTNFHLNDYPAQPERETIRDSHRVFPGDGVAPLAKIITSLWEIGFRGALSLELFNQEYWKKPPLEMAREGLEKMKKVVTEALATRQA
ncbi:MAG: sugar phosphate isomerase/epimerase family protein [Thermoguttaceae bacterium]|nr:sugar phosphate isomerase/epimerase family protein [Thermoguttaceae bacterium]